MNRKAGPVLVLLAALTAAGAAFAASPAGQPRSSVRAYSFGVVPQYEQRKLHDIWEPIIRQLEERTGLRFTLMSALTINAFENDVAAGRFDFLYTNPYHILKESRNQHYLPLVRDKAPLRGILVVRKDSPFRKPSDLNGRIVAMPSPNALGASLLLRADLERLFHTTVKPLYVKTHSSVYLNVIAGVADGGGGVEKTLREQSASVRDALRIIYTTRSMPSHPIAAHPRVPERDREAVRSALLALGRTAQGRELFAKVPITDLVPASMADYEAMSGWGLDSYWDALTKGE